MAYKLEWEKQGVVIRYAGRVDIDEVLRAQRDYEGNARFDSLRYVIIDTLAVIEVCTKARDAETVWVNDAGASTSNSRIRKAFIATDPSAIAFANAYKDLNEPGYELRTFEAEGDARQWLTAELGTGIK